MPLASLAIHLRAVPIQNLPELDGVDAVDPYTRSYALVH
jgi:hypothetical protein